LSTGASQRSASSHAPALARRVVFHLIALDLADAEVMRVRVAEVEPAHRRARPHREALGQLHADALGLDQRNSVAFSVWSGCAG
jgi:hypothetical protein